MNNNHLRPHRAQYCDENEEGSDIEDALTDLSDDEEEVGKK